MPATSCWAITLRPSATTAAANAITPAAVKLSAEVSDLSEPMRHALETGTARVIGHLQEAIERGIAEGSLSVAMSPAATAETLYSLWLGASLRARIRHSLAPLTSALESIELLLRRRNRNGNNFFY